MTDKIVDDPQVQDRLRQLERFERLRQAYGLTASQAAGIVGTSRATLSRGRCRLAQEGACPGRRPVPAVPGASDDGHGTGVGPADADELPGVGRGEAGTVAAGAGIRGFRQHGRAHSGLAEGAGPPAPAVGARPRAPSGAAVAAPLGATRAL